MVRVDWKGNLAFEATTANGAKFVMDVTPDSFGEASGLSPLDTLISAAAACSAVDVVAILEKKRMTIQSYHIEVDGERTAPGVYPRPYVSLTIQHILTGPDLTEDAVRQAVQLSDEKYCSAIATLRAGPTITSTFQIKQPVS